jgi:protein-disulfide isomerase
LKSLNYLLSIFVIFALTGCDVAIKKTLENNPDIVFDTIKKNPGKFMKTVQEAMNSARMEQAKEEEANESKNMEEEFKNPKKPMISEGRAVLGKPDAPITIVEYSDFQCPFCSRGYLVVKEMKEKYGDKVRFMYKHLPLMDKHPEAMPAAQYFEAIALQSKEKAYKFHDMIFENQDKLNSGKTKFLDDLTKQVGADLAKVKKDMKSDVVAKNIQADMEEARKFEFNGTPGFLVNGVSVRGAYPIQHFQKIIDRQLGGKAN